jgi:GTP pyrophosphokinase
MAKQTKDEIITELISKLKRSKRKHNISFIEKVYKYADEKHKGEFRKSGEEYIIHPVNVAYILGDLDLDDATICAALLHDTIEDTGVTREELIKEFGHEIVELVDGVTKLSNLAYVTKEEQLVEDYRKMFLAMGKDIRVILIKLADRLHNMRTLEYLPHENQLTNARETMELYAPLANRLRNV